MDRVRQSHFGEKARPRALPDTCETSEDEHGSREPGGERERRREPRQGSRGRRRPSPSTIPAATDCATISTPVVVSAIATHSAAAAKARRPEPSRSRRTIDSTTSGAHAAACR